MRLSIPPKAQFMKGCAMKHLTTTLLIASFSAVALPASADEQNDRFVAACVSDGDTQAVCECTADAMQSTFSAEQFAQIVAITEAGDNLAGGRLFQSIFAAEPSLASVFQAAMDACQ